MAGVQGRSGRRPTFDRQYQIQNMWQVHHEIVRLALLGLGNKEIADKLGCTPQTVCNCLNSRIAMDKLSILRAQRDAASVDVATAIADLAPACVETLNNLMQDSAVNPAVRAGCAKDLLDRAGHGAVKKVQAETITTHLTREDIEDIKRRAMEAGRESGVVVVNE